MQDNPLYGGLSSGEVQWGRKRWVTVDFTTFIDEGEYLLKKIPFTIFHIERIFKIMKQNTRIAVTPNQAACRKAAAARHCYYIGAGG